MTETTTIETELSAKISDADLLKDIRITEQELGAYQKIAEGFAVLVSIPDQLPAGVAKYRTQHMVYAALESRCAAFLRKLHGLKAERGL